MHPKRAFSKKKQQKSPAVEVGKIREIKTPSTAAKVTYVTRKDAKRKTMIA
jgi:hypothetical protein